MVNKLEANIEKIFREHGKHVLATLIGLFGSHNLHLAEDCLQETFAKALNHWRQKGLPENPPAWLMLTAKNQAIDILRKQSKSTSLEPTLNSGWTLKSVVDTQFEKTKDNEIQLLIWIATTDLDEVNQLAIMLKWLCGLSMEETANALLISYENAKKRLQRARSQLSKIPFEIVDTALNDESLAKVHIALYLLFSRTIDPLTEQSENTKMLCLQSIGLAKLLLDDKRTSNSESFALYALMHFHHARHLARLNGDFLNIPIDLQDRRKWHYPLIADGTQLLDTSLDLVDKQPGRFLLEALTAYEHCRATRFEQTNWLRIIDYYNKLYALTESPMYLISLAAAKGYAGEAESGIQLLESIEDSKKTAITKHLYATKAFLLAFKGAKTLATEAFEVSVLNGLSDSEQSYLLQRIENVLNPER